jgi:dTDP-4-amino-4,6-dideoxygalactose transaminase
MNFSAEIFAWTPCKLLRTKLPHCRSLIEKRQTNAAHYLTFFKNAALAPEQLQLPQRVGPDHTYNQFVIQIPNRDALQLWLKERGIESAVYYPEPLHRQPIFDECQTLTSGFPATEKACERVLALPIHPSLRVAEIQRISVEVFNFLKSI